MRWLRDIFSIFGVFSIKGLSIDDILRNDEDTTFGVHFYVGAFPWLL